MRLELRGVTKRFGDIVANDSIDLVIEPGQIHALLGENGAGKSTLMNVLYGLYEADSGEILLDDKPVHFSGPGEAMAAGIGMVHQHFMLVPVFTVAENVVLGHEPIRRPLGLINVPKARGIVREISDQFHFEVDPDALVETLPVGIQQRVEIIKALSRKAQVLILDEPTAVLTPQETDELMGIMRDLAASGTSIVFITHKLREVQEVADVITVIRDGRVVGQAPPSASQTELAEMMVGRAVELGVKKSQHCGTDVTLSVKGLTLIDKFGRTLIDNINFDIHAGEILTVAGVQGNGQTELAETLIGLRKPTSGTVTLYKAQDGKRVAHDLTGKSVHAILNEGVGYVPEDRSKDGMIAEFLIDENLVLDQIDQEPFSKAGGINTKAIADNGRKQVKDFDVRTPSSQAPISTLSGGNQQKVVLAREMSKDLTVFIASQPTRGVDVGSIEFIDAQVVRERDAGAAVLLVSTELSEVTALADRIAVMYRGKLVGVVHPRTDRNVLGLMMAGVSLEEATGASGTASKQDSSPPHDSESAHIEGALHIGVPLTPDPHQPPEGGGRHE